jgi:peptide chain release factor 1
VKLVEIRAAEGGAHSRRLVESLLGAYSARCRRHGAMLSILERRDGYVLLKTDADDFFLGEVGGHRWQGLSKGTIHTSTITVATMEESSEQFRFDPTKMIVEYYRSSGPGGQNKNKVETACRIKYGDLIVTCGDERSKRQNYDKALLCLKRRLEIAHRSEQHHDENATRKAQIGFGERADKMRTYREKDDIVIDHRTGRKARLSDLLRGKWFD